jgi:hypothetical protein
VRRIFTEYATGRSPRAIAKALNRDGVAGPSGKPWGASTIHGNWRRGTGILNNELYVGRLVWNRLRYSKDPNTGKRVSRLNPAAALIMQPVPDLRIIDDDLWAAVKTRQGAHQDLVERTGGGYRLNATHRRRYLFSGLLTCGVCGGGYTITGNDRYGCANYRNRGTCGNSAVIRRQELEARVLAGLKDKLLAPALVKEFIAEFHAELNRRNRESELGYEASRRELAETERKIASILRAIEDGVYTGSTKDRLLHLEKRKAELEAMKPVPPTPRLHPNLAALYASKVAGLEEALNEPDAREQAGEALRGLVDEIRLTPDPASGLQIELYGELGAILAIGQGTNANRPGDVPRRFSLVAGRGFEPLTFRL